MSNSVTELTYTERREVFRLNSMSHFAKMSSSFLFVFTLYIYVLILWEPIICEQELQFRRMT